MYHASAKLAVDVMRQLFASIGVITLLHSDELVR
jgi:hypothetical protein